MGVWRLLAILPVSLLPVTLFLGPSRVDPTEQILGRYGRADAYYQDGAGDSLMTRRADRFLFWEFEREYRVRASRHQMMFVYDVRHWPPGRTDRLIEELCQIGWFSMDRRDNSIDLLWPPHSSIHIRDGRNQIIYCRPATLSEQIVYGVRPRGRELAAVVGR